MQKNREWTGGEDKTTANEPAVAKAVAGKLQMYADEINSPPVASPDK